MPKPKIVPVLTPPYFWIRKSCPKQVEIPVNPRNIRQVDTIPPAAGENSAMIAPKIAGKTAIAIKEFATYRQNTFTVNGFRFSFPLLVIHNQNSRKGIWKTDKPKAASKTSGFNNQRRLFRQFSCDRTQTFSPTSCENHKRGYFSSITINGTPLTDCRFFLWRKNRSLCIENGVIACVINNT